MKPLTEYPTPETDEISAGYIEMAGNGQFRYGPMDFARKSRDLERRLAACRQALGMITTHDPSDNQCDNGWSPSYIASEALTLTAPKQ